MKSPSC